MSGASWINIIIIIISFLQDFVNFKSFWEKKAKELLKEGSKGADVNEGKFVLNIDVLFALYYLFLNEKKDRI
jgi:hypothetical protein